MYLYAPPFSIVKKQDNKFAINDILGGKYWFNKKLLTETLKIIGKEEEDLSKEEKEIAINIVNSGFLKRTKYRRNDYFNYEKVRERILKNKGKKNDLMNIGSVTFALIKQCPYNCEECYAKDRIQKEETSNFEEESLYNTIKQISKLGAKDVSISGGEPTTSRKTLEKTIKISEMLKLFGLSQRLITTGYNLKKYSKELFSSSINHYQISLDGLEEYNDKYKRYHGATKRSIEAIKECQKSEKEYSINTVITKNNLKQLKEFVRFLEKNNANNLRIAKVISGNPKNSLTIEESKKLKEMIEDLKEKSKLVITGPFDNQYIQRKNVDCVAGKLYAHIDCYGDVFPCAFMQNLPLGSIYEKEFTEIWSLNNPTLRDFEEGITPDVQCIKCNDRYYCFGNCRKEYELRNEKSKK